MGLISGRKAFQRPLAEGVELLNAIQDVYLDAGSHGRVTDPLLASEGWGVIHCYYRLRGRPPRGDRRWPMPTRLADGVHRRARYQAIWTRAARRPRRPRADADRPRPGAPRALPRRTSRARELGRRLEPVPELGLVSMTELSEYTPREGSEEHMAMLERRVHPRLPRKRLLCFYPMAKRRDGRRQLVLARLRRAARADGRPRQARRASSRAA